MQEKENYSGFAEPLRKLCEFQMKRRCADVDEQGNHMSLPLTGLAAAEQLAFFCGAQEEPFRKNFNITAHVRSFRNIITLSQADAQKIEEIFSEDKEYLDYLKSEDGEDTLLVFLVKNNVNSIPVAKVDTPVDFDDEKSRNAFYEKKEKAEREREDQQIINGVICSARELTVSHRGYNECDYETDEIVADYEDFCSTFNRAIEEGRSEKVAYSSLEKLTVNGRIALIDDFVQLFTSYAMSHPEDSYFINSLGNDLAVFGIYASEDDALLAEDIEKHPDQIPISKPEIVKL